MSRQCRVRQRRDQGRHHQPAGRPDLRRHGRLRSARKQSKLQDELAHGAGGLDRPEQRPRAVRGGLPACARRGPVDRARLAAPAQRRPGSSGGSGDRDEIARAHHRSAEALAVVEPLVDGRFYYAGSSRSSAAGVQPVYSLRVDTDDHAFVTNGFVSHNTESRLTPLAMEMLRDIDEDTVDFSAELRRRTPGADVLPARFPNLLVNGGPGIAVGMATNIPPHNLREIADGVSWAWSTRTPTRTSCSPRCMERIKGPDFPTARADRRPRRDRGRVPDRPRLDPHARRGRRSRRTPAGGPAWSSPSCRTRSTRTTWPRRSPTRSRRASWPASATSRDESSATGSAAGWSSRCAATPSPRSC